MHLKTIRPDNKHGRTRLFLVLADGSQKELSGGLIFSDPDEASRILQEWLGSHVEHALQVRESSPKEDDILSELGFGPVPESTSEPVDETAIFHLPKRIRRRRS